MQRIGNSVRLHMVSKEQIQRFFAKQCTAEEAEQVAAWLKTHPEDASAYFEEAEWQNTSVEEPMPNEVYTRSWQWIQEKIKTGRYRFYTKGVALAACVTGCFAIGVFYLANKKTVSVQTSANAIVAPMLKLPVTDTEHNLTSKPRRILLADGSVITLPPMSVVWFDTPFAKANTRDIHLAGEARFEVARNKQKPFTVYSGSFSTTALGTEFTVKEVAHNIKVQLVHGKVVIKNTDYSVKNWENVYLLPGQQMIYNENDALARVSSIKEPQALSSRKISATNSTQIETSDSLIFNGSPMKTVLKKLHDYYRVQIQFADEDIRNISFTGVIVKKDSVQTILKAITQMNGLSVEGSADSSFIISKERN